jgi:hypothetical protein
MRSRTLLAIALLAGCAEGTMPDTIGADGPDASHGDGAIDAGPTFGPDASVIVSPEPDAGPTCTTSVANILGDGGFDVGGAPWVQASSQGYQILVPEGNVGMFFAAQSPTWLAWLGGANNMDDELHQDLAIPAGATQIVLRGYRRATSSDDPAGVFDSCTLALRTTAGVVLEQLGAWDNQDTTDGWVAFEATAAGTYAGQTIRFSLAGHTDPTYVSNFFFDSLQVEVTSCN